MYIQAIARIAGRIVEVINSTSLLRKQRHKLRYDSGEVENGL
jgi:hypothetical protein